MTFQSDTERDLWMRVVVSTSRDDHRDHRVAPIAHFADLCVEEFRKRNDRARNMDGVRKIMNLDAAHCVVGGSDGD